MQLTLLLKPIQVMVITGASCGIRLATAEAAARKGARLVLGACSQHALEQIVVRFNANGSRWP